METTIFGGGCFWCLEAVFQRVKGVKAVQSGYMGGDLARPSYERVCSGQTGHAEIVRIDFDPQVIGFESLLDIFFAIHDPTTLNRQGHDVGTQYRSAIFAVGAAQHAQAQSFIQGLSEFGAYKEKGPIVTDLHQVTHDDLMGLSESVSKTFWPAEAEHDNYFERNPYQGYCMAVVLPKVEKATRLFADKVF